MRDKIRSKIEKPAIEMPNSEKALARLMAGNRRYVNSKQTHPDQSPDRRIALQEGQHPFAVILGCADSRVPPEVIFDQGLGDLFTVRIAGNVLDDIILGSIEYAELHLFVPLIMVLGHSGCGAVQATVSVGDLEGHLPSLTDAIKPALELVKEQPGNLVNNAAKKNALMVAEQIKQRGEHFSQLIDEGKLLVVAAYYDLETGIVELLENT